MSRGAGRTKVVRISGGFAPASGVTLDLRPCRVQTLVLATLVAVLTIAFAGPASAAYGAVLTGSRATAPAASPIAAPPSSVLAWGDNESGQLGDGTSSGPERCDFDSACSRTPVDVNGLSGVTAISASESDNLVLLDNGTVMAWGDNGYGQLGDGTTSGPELCGGVEPCSETPVPVSGLSGVTAISAGGDHSLALLENGTVMAWGYNDRGQLGDGESGEETSSDVPVPVSGLSGVAAISAGEGLSLALLKNGTVMAWGQNYGGVLGDGKSGEGADSDVPAPVTGLSGVTAISTSGGHSLALLENGTVMAWGHNYGGQLGGASSGPELCGGIEPCSTIPVPVTGLSRVTAISAGGDDSLALLENGTVMAWGENLFGQLGDGTTTGPELCAGSQYGSCSTRPEAVTGLSGVTAISASGWDGMALLRNGSVMDWGWNRWGVLGSTNTAESDPDSDLPGPRTGLSAVTAIAAGGSQSLAISAQPMITGVEPNSGVFAGGTSVRVAGIHFTGVMAVKFGSANASRFEVNSATSITAISPAGSGIVDVTVSTKAGTSPVATVDQFSYEPAVTGVQPNDAPAAGRPSVTVTGTNFAEATAVKFGAVDAVRFRVRSASSITAVPPPGTGTVNVTVTTPGGTSTVGTADLFTYATRGEWTIVPSPNFGPTANRLAAISCASLGSCMAVGHDAQLGSEALIDVWNGSAWSPVAAPQPPESRSETNLSGVSCASAGFCVAVGTLVGRAATPGCRCRSVLDVWSHARWSEAKSPVVRPPHLRGVSCISSSFCVAVGRDEPGQGMPPRPLVESWNGETWSGIPSPAPEGVGELEGVSCVSTKFCVAVGNTFFGHRALVESWNGAEWSVVPSPSTVGSLHGVSCVSARHCVAVGQSSSHTLVESWDGSTWAILESPNPEGIGVPQLNGVSCVSARSCTAVGSDSTAQGPSQTLVETSKGSKWSIAPSANGATDQTELDGVSCVSTGSCFAVGDDEATPEGPLQTLVESGRVSSRFALVDALT
jgi:alpha-tubulin suppressor-like RCC1 family protein